MRCRAGATSAQARSYLLARLRAVEALVPGIALTAPHPHGRPCSLRTRHCLFCEGRSTHLFKPRLKSKNIAAAFEISLILLNKVI